MEDRKENIPAVRFKGFTDAWEQRKLGETISKSIKGKATISMIGIKSTYLDANYLNGGDEIYVDSLSDVQTNDILILWDGSKAGTVYHGFEGALGSTLRAYRPIESSSFLFQQLKKQQQLIYKSYRTPNIPHVIKNFTEEFKVSIPLLGEQEKVGDLFSTLDTLITLQQRELELLKNMKKSLLKAMFI